MPNFLKQPAEITKLTDFAGGCLASNRITVDGQPVGYAYREQPDANFTGDSGWRFLAGDEDDAYLANPDNFHIFEVNTICNYDPTLLDIINSEIDTSFRKSPSGQLLPDNDNIKE